MAKMKPGVTGFIPRGSDPWASLEKFAQIGYKGSEHSGIVFREGDPVENVKRVNDLGLQLLSIGTSVRNEVYPDVKELVRRVRIIGANRVGVSHTSATDWRFADRPELPEYDEIMREIGRIDKLSKELREEGITLTFHNHDQEFLTAYNGVPLFWLMASNCEYLKFVLDIGWVVYAGVDCAKLVRLLGNRVIELHVKDYTRGENYEYKPLRTVLVPRYTTPGTGLVDMEAVFKAAVEVGTEWAVIEQDMEYNLSREDAARTAYYIMKETGYVE